MVGMRGSSQPLDVLSVHQFDQPALAQHGVGEVEPGELDLLRVRRCRADSMNQSYSGRWFSNSSVQIEWVMPSMESDWPWAQSYIG